MLPFRDVCEGVGPRRDTQSADGGGVRGLHAARADDSGRPRGAGDTVGPASCAYRLSTLTIIAEMLDVDLHRGPPGRGWKMAGHP